MANQALVVIDMQNSLVNGIQTIYKGQEIIKNIIELVDKAHEAKIPVIFVQHTTQEPGSPMEKDSLGWQIIPEIPANVNDYFITKYTPDSFYQTNLMDILKANEVDKLLICGLQTEYCIDTTCRRAFTLGYDTYLIEDANSTFDVAPLSAEKIIEHHHRIMAEWFATLIPTSQVKF